MVRCANCGTPTAYPVSRCQWCPSLAGTPISKEELYPHIYPLEGGDAVSVDTAVQDEKQSVVGWRDGELRRVGYPIQMADKLAKLPHVDLHLAVWLVQNGCSPELACQILE